MQLMMSSRSIPLAGSVVLITGAGSGLGRHVAHQLAQLGCRLALVDADASAVTQLAEHLAAAGHDARGYRCDISELEEVAATLARIAHDFDGSLDILINNAGIWTDEEIEARDPSRRRTAFLVNALGPIQVTDAALPLLRAGAPNAQILNVVSSSAASDTTANDNRRWSTYGATKAALAGFTTTLTAQLAPEAIKVSALFPGGFESDMYERAGSADEHHDAVWMMRTEDIADIIVFVLTRPADVQIERVLVTKRSTDFVGI
jgi:NAD(P)-dependent dehydrogenase (short-subunit alcohol dehydrogenase family)